MQDADAFVPRRDFQLVQECFNAIAKTKSLSPLLISILFPDFSPITNSSSLILGSLLHSYLVTLILNSYRIFRLPILLFLFPLYVAKCCYNEFN